MELDAHGAAAHAAGRDRELAPPAVALPDRAPHVGGDAIGV